MRPSTGLVLLVIVFCIALSHGKKKGNTPNRKNQPNIDKGKNKVSPSKPAKKDESEVSEKDESHDEEEEEEEADDDEKAESGDDDEEDQKSDDDDEDSHDNKESDSDSDEDDESGNFLSSEEFIGDLRELIKEKGIFYSVESIKQYFRDSKFHGDSEIEDMFQRYNTSEIALREKLAEKPEKQMMPFYVVEGVNPDTRKKVAQILAHRVKGLYMVNQPRVMLGPVLKDEEARRAYYSFSKYMLASRIRMALVNKPVVVERYWMDHASYVMAKVWKKATKLPKPGAEVYTFPEDLLVPNITFVICNTPPPRLGKPPSNTYLFEQRMLLVYKRFQGAKIHIIRSPQSAKLIAHKIDIYLHNLGQTHPMPLTNLQFSIDY